MKNHFLTGLVTATLNVIIITLLNTTGFIEDYNTAYVLFSSTSFFLLLGVFSTIQTSVTKSITDTSIMSNFKEGLKPVLFFLIGSLVSLFIYFKYVNPEWLPNKNKSFTEAQIQAQPYETWANEHPRLAENKNQEEYELDVAEKNKNFLSIQFGLSVISILIVVIGVVYSLLSSVLITKVLIKTK